MRSRVFRDGDANASREAVARLHEEAEGMNDPRAKALLPRAKALLPRAKALLNGAAHALGHHVARRRERMATPPAGGPERPGRGPCG